MADASRYADAFSVDRGRSGCWRYVYEGTDAGAGSGRPVRCAGEVQWAGQCVTRHRSWRVWSCDGHLDGGEGWVERPGRRHGGAPDF